MGRQADTEVRAGAEGTGTEAAPKRSRAPAPRLRLVGSIKRRQILEAMLEVAGAEGYEQTSVQKVLDRAGLYRQAFYDNFEDKDDCYVQAFEAGLQRVEALVVAAAAGEASWEGKLRAGLGALLDFLDAEPDTGRGLVVEVHAGPPEAMARRAEAMQRMANFIELARSEAGGAETPPPIAAEGIVAGIHAVIHSRLSSGAGSGFRELLPEFMYFAVLPYFGAETAEEEMRAASA